jgi:hypothetical protein
MVAIGQLYPWRKMATYPSKQFEEDTKDKLDMMGNPTLLSNLQTHHHAEVKWPPKM